MVRQRHQLPTSQKNYGSPFLSSALFELCSLCQGTAEIISQNWKLLSDEVHEVDCEEMMGIKEEKKVHPGELERKNPIGNGIRFISDSQVHPGCEASEFKDFVDVILLAEIPQALSFVSCPRESIQAGDR